MRASRGLKWENKMYKLKRSIHLLNFSCYVSGFVKENHPKMCVESFEFTHRDLV